MPPLAIEPQLPLANLAAMASAAAASSKVGPAARPLFCTAAHFHLLLFLAYDDSMQPPAPAPSLHSEVHQAAQATTH